MTTIKQIFFELIRRIKPLYAIQLKIQSEYNARYAFSNPKSPPIIIYQMGKVGSSTVYKSLRDDKIPNPVLHLHFLSKDLPKHRKIHEKAGIYPLPDHIYLGESVRKILNKNFHSPCKIISLVRDPIAIVISNLFQNPKFAKENLINYYNEIDPERAVRYIERELCNPDTFNYINNWFDRELKQVFDIDVFASPFPVSIGYSVYRKGSIDALIIRLEDLSEKGSKAISDYLGFKKPIILKYSNVRNKKNDAKSYRKVLNNIRISPSLCKEIYSSRFVQHFYDKTMINKFILKWSKYPDNDQ